MKRFITFKDVNIKIGELYKNERNTKTTHTKQGR